MMALLADIRWMSVQENRQVIVKFRDSRISISGVPDSVEVTTLHDVNYDTTMGNDMIVFSGGMTNRHNVRVHGGELILRSWLGFNKSIHVNCTGLSVEGKYPEE